MLWCDESVATDHVPAERMTRQWVLQRARSHGNAETLVELLAETSIMRARAVRVAAVARGSVRVIAGGLRFVVGAVGGSVRHQARGLRTVNRGIGIASAALGFAAQEYARDATHELTGEHIHG